MNTVIEMAREAQIVPYIVGPANIEYIGRLERFAALVRAEALAEQPAQQEPWGACVYGRVFVGRLPEHARKFSEDEGVPIQWLYTSPQSQRKPLTDDHTKLLWHEARRCIGPRWMVFKRLIEAAHGINQQQTKD